MKFYETTANSLCKQTASGSSSDCALASVDLSAFHRKVWSHSNVDFMTFVLAIGELLWPPRGNQADVWRREQVGRLPDAVMSRICPASQRAAWEWGAQRPVTHLLCGNDCSALSSVATFANTNTDAGRRRTHADKQQRYLNYIWPFSFTSNTLMAN